ncbi:MAG: hypothetical protein PHY09_16880 [Desulfuromonadaceae bacterium]|nr:hypothetical protein [Desulfuromonadaceae bacterium]MDD5105634.1 hypothetical protein [Desulfuromonadaceae bacterium]
MGVFNLLTETRIREWQQRVPDTTQNMQETPSVPLSDDPLEVQLFKEILTLLDKDSDEQTDSATRDELRAKAGLLETQLMVLLEQSGRPLAARQLAATINTHRVQR